RLEQSRPEVTRFSPVHKSTRRHSRPCGGKAHPFPRATHACLDRATSSIATATRRHARSRSQEVDSRGLSCREVALRDVARCPSRNVPERAPCSPDTYLT